MPLQVSALAFKDKAIDDAVIRLDEILDNSEWHFDTDITNDFTSGLAGNNNRTYRGFAEYRLESHHQLYNLNSSKFLNGYFGKQHQGIFVQRTNGIGFIDNRINDFIDDPLVDFPEFFLEDNFKADHIQGKFAFGKFATRRFFNKDEIFPDVFDIGERRFSGAIVNTLLPLSTINEFRDKDQALYGTRDATGSFGMMFDINPNEKYNKGVLKGIGLRQGFQAARLDDFIGNFYGISEMYKQWGLKKPGQFNLGFLYANDAVYRIPNNQKNDYLLYSSLVQKFGKLNTFLRYGTLFAEESNSSNDAKNQIQFGGNYKINPRNSLTTWFAYYDFGGYLNFDNYMQLTFVHTFNLTNNLTFRTALVERFNQSNSAATNSSDNDWTLALHLGYFH